MVPTMKSSPISWSSGRIVYDVRELRPLYPLSRCPDLINHPKVAFRPQVLTRHRSSHGHTGLVDAYFFS
jgi:hypothetical protein